MPPLEEHLIELPGIFGFMLSHDVAKRLSDSQNSKFTGNVVLNFKDGAICSMKVEEFLRLDKTKARG